jgi:hypothetical protein
LARICEFNDADGIGFVIERKSLGARVHVESLLRVQVGAGGMETAFDLRRHRAFDADGPEVFSGKSEKKVHLSSIGGSIIARLGSVRRCCNQCLYDKALPGLTDDRMTE